MIIQSLNTNNSASFFTTPKKHWLQLVQTPVNRQMNKYMYYTNTMGPYSAINNNGGMSM